jgi:hypothetical protein
MDFLKNIFQTFVYVLAGITVCAAIFISIFVRDISISIMILWQIIAMAAVCTFGNGFYYHSAVLSKKQMKIRVICHYLYINLVVFAGAIMWDWITPGMIPEFVALLLQVAVVYAAVMIANFHQQEKVADKFNQRLRKIYPRKEEKED